MTIEGSPASKLIGIIRKYGANTDVLIEFGTVTSPPPGLRIKVDNMRIELEADDVVIAESLTDYTVKVSLSGGSVSGNVTGGGGGTLSSLTVTDADLTVNAGLKTGDRVILAQINNGQTYVVLDRMGAI